MSYYNTPLLQFFAWPGAKNSYDLSLYHVVEITSCLAKLFLVRTLLSIFDRSVGLKITRQRRDVEISVRQILRRRSLRFPKLFSRRRERLHRRRSIRRTMISTTFHWSVGCGSVVVCEHVQSNFPVYYVTVKCPCTNQQNNGNCKINYTYKIIILSIKKTNNLKLFWFLVIVIVKYLTCSSVKNQN